MSHCNVLLQKNRKNDALIRNLISNDDIEEDTVWKFQDFSNTQILREIETGEYRGSKPDNFTHLEAMNSDFYAFLYFLKSEIYQIN